MSAGTITVASMTRDLRAAFRKAGFDDPALEARIVLELAGLSRHSLLTDPDQIVAPDFLTRIDAALERRLAGAPPGRIAGRKRFFDFEVALNAATLEPRADTEVLVDVLEPHVERLLSRHGKCRIADIGTGTGVIAIALARLSKRVRAVATDIQRRAVMQAAANARACGVGGQVDVRWCSLLDQGRIPGRFDIIVSNPPYIRRAVLAGLDRAVRQHDPHAALDGGVDGLDVYRGIARLVPDRLQAHGVLALEIGFDQRAAVTALLATSDGDFRAIVPHSDLAGRDRVILAERRLCPRAATRPV